MSTPQIDLETQVFGTVPLPNLPLATESGPGIAQPDGSSITVSAGVLTAAAGAGLPAQAASLGGEVETLWREVKAIKLALFDLGVDVNEFLSESEA